MNSIRTLLPSTSANLNLPSSNPFAKEREQSEFEGSTNPFVKEGENLAVSKDAIASWSKEYDDYARKLSEEQRQWSAEQAQKQMDFQERMASTQYQRAVDDMKKAGLNPYALMGGGFTSASAPSGAQATTDTARQYSMNDMLKLLAVDNNFTVGMINSLSKLLKVFS